MKDTMQKSRTSLTAKKRFITPDVVALTCILIVYACFNLLLMQKFFPITEGWFQDISRYIIDGKVIYRDFYMFIPPGYPIMMSLLYRVFGGVYIWYRLFGVAERLLIVALSYHLLRRFFSTRSVFIGLITSSIVYISNAQDVFYGYYQTSLLWMVVMTYFCVRLYDSDGKKSVINAVLFGIATGMATLFKHTSGVILGFALVVVYFLLSIRINWKKGALNALVCVLSASVVVGAACLWLNAYGALQPCFQQLFGSGVSAKGALSTVLFGFLIRMLSDVKAWITAVLLALLLFSSIQLENRNNLSKKWSVLKVVNLLLVVCSVLLFILMLRLTVKFSDFVADLSPWFIAVVAFSIALIAALIYLQIKLKDDFKSLWIAYIGWSFLLCAGFIIMQSTKGQYLDWNYFREERFHIWNGLFFMSIFYSGVLLLRALIKGDNTHGKLIIVVASWAIMYIHGMSGFIEDHAMLLCLAIFICRLLETVSAINLVKNILIYAFCVITILTVFLQRLWLPYEWWGSEEISPSYQATYQFEDPNLKGIYSSEAYTEEMNALYELLKNNIQPGDTLYTFPHINYFSIMTGLKNDMFSKVHFFDVCTDEVAISDAKRLVQDKPDFIIYEKLTPEAWEIHEALYRSGKPSGQRKLFKTIQNLTHSVDYELLGVFHIGGEDPVYVYQRVSALSDGGK